MESFGVGSHKGNIWVTKSVFRKKAKDVKDRNPTVLE